MRRHYLDIQAIASLDNLAHAAHRAGLAKRQRHEVGQFFQDLLPNLARLRAGLLDGRLPKGHFFRFQIWDPKPRVIHAPCFEDRVVHHALMRFCEPVLDRALVATTFACRKRKGTLAAVKRAHQNARRWPWFAKVDVRSYFDSIDHQILLNLMQRKFKGKGIAALFARIISSYATSQGKGLPIGSLTSQIWANYYLDGFDRFLIESLKVGAHVRYMDDVVWWTTDRESARAVLARVSAWVKTHRDLHLKANSQVNRTPYGMTFLGYRIFPHGPRLSRRRKRRYTKALADWERGYAAGALNPLALQRAYAGVHAICAHAGSLRWRQSVLRERKAMEV